MLVKDYMSRHPFMLEEDSSIVDAQHYMHDVHVRHLPVVSDGKRLLGLITRETLMIEPGSLDSLNVWEITRYLSSMKVKKIMVKAKDVITIEEDAAIEDAATLMVVNKIGCLPVLKGKIVTGIITQEDLLAQLSRMLVARRPGVRLTLGMADKQGELARLESFLYEKGWEIKNVSGVPDPNDKGKYIAVLRFDPQVVKEDVRKAVNQVGGFEILDIRDGT